MTDLKTVIIVCDTAKVDGGLGKVAVTSAIALAKLGLSVVYFCPTSGADPGLGAAGVDVISLDQQPVSEDPQKLRGMLRGLWNATAARALKGVLDRHDPASTIIHCHGFSKALSPAIGPVLTSGPYPCVYTMHEFFLSCPNGGFFDFPRAEICRRKPLGLSCLSTNCDSRHGAHKAWRLARQAILHGPGKLPRALRDIIYISETQRKVMAPAVGHARLHHVPNPVDFSDSQRVAVENNDVFLFVGRLERDKGGLELAKAARAAGVRAVFVGAGREEKAICDILPEVEITGWLSPADVSAWLGRARCLVFPSLWYECQPLVPMEAIHKGVPVITGRWNAAQEIVTHNRTGLIYDRPEDLPTTLKMMGAEVAKSMSTKAYANRANVGSTPEQHAQDLLKVYADTMCHHAL